MNKKCTCIMKLALCCILGLSFLVGCGVDSKTLPKITSIDYQISEGRIVANASDDVKVTGYLLTYSNEEPKLDDESWIESGIFYEFKVGKAKVWVKDGDGNLAYDEILIEDPVVLLAKDYEFLAWYLDESTSKTVDGVSYDLTALKQKYGDLYRFIEPLSKEEVEHRFKYLAEYYAEIFDKGIIQDTGGIIVLSNEILTNVSKRVKPFYEPMSKQELGDEFKMFSKYYEYLEKTQSYYPNHPITMYYEEEYYDFTLIKIIDTIPLEDKNWFVRHNMFLIDVTLAVYKEMGIQPTFVISPLN